MDYSDFIGSDPAGNPVTVFNPVISTKRVTVDNQAPEIKVVALSTDNRLSGNLYDSNGVQREDELVTLRDDNVTLKFETDERVFRPKVRINGDQKIAVPQTVSGNRIRQEPNGRLSTRLKPVTMEVLLSLISARPTPQVILSFMTI